MKRLQYNSTYAEDIFINNNIDMVARDLTGHPYQASKTTRVTGGWLGWWYAATGVFQGWIYYDDNPSTVPIWESV